MLIPLEFNKFGVDFINTTCISDSVYSASLENINRHHQYDKPFLISSKTVKNVEFKDKFLTRKPRLYVTPTMGLEYSSSVFK